MGDYSILCYFCPITILFSVLVGSHGEGLKEDPGCWTHIGSTLTRKLLQPTLIISTLIGLFSVVIDEPDEFEK